MFLFYLCGLQSQLEIYIFYPDGSKSLQFVLLNDLLGFSKIVMLCIIIIIIIIRCSVI